MIKQPLIYFVFLFITGNYTAQINEKDKNGLRNGPWKVNFEGTNKPKFEGTFRHGKEVGFFKFYKRGFYEHPAAIMNFKDDSDSVSVTYYTQTGKPISKGVLINRQREGKWLYFHEKTDSIMMEEHYERDKLQGQQITYYPDGQIAEKTFYDSGQKHGESLIFAKNGQITKRLNYDSGELHGPAAYFNPQGEKIMEGNYSSGRKTGLWKYYSEGKLEREENH